MPKAPLFRAMAVAFLWLLGAPAATAQVHDVVLSEIAWMGTLASANDEWLELFNNTSNDIDLTGWTLVSADGAPSIALSGVIPAHGHFLLERTDDATVPGVTADQIYTGALGNTVEDLALRDGLSTLQDRVDAWYAGNNTTKTTMERADTVALGTLASSWTNGPVGGTPMNSGGGGSNCAPPTRTVECQPGGPFPFPIGGPVVINEVMLNPAAVADSAGEYVELFNSGTTTVNLEGWVLRDDDSDTFTIATGGPVPLAPGASYVIAGTADPATNGGFTPDLTWTGFFLSNSGDEVVLADSFGVEQDRLVYSDAPFTTSSGRSLERVSSRLPTSDPLTWVEGRSPLSLGDLGTPGAVNTLQARRYVLRGTIVSMDETLSVAERVFPGALYIQGNRILAVLHETDPLPADAIGASDIQTGALIFPGLMNIHDHLTFNTLRAWDVPGLMQDVSDWTSLDDYRRHVRYPDSILTDAPYYALLPEAGKYAEAKALMAGTTAVQGSFPLSPGFSNHLTRNVDLSNFGADRIRQRALSVLDSSFQSTEAPALVAAMEAGEVDAWLIHLAEGTSEDAPLEFSVLRDVCLVRSETVIIHGTSLTPDELDEAATAGMKLIIAPTSNYLYYGATADVVGAVQRGIPVSLSTDWSPAGDKNLLASLKTVALLNNTVWGGALSDRQIIEMVTTSPARTLNWCDRVGAVRAGMFADLAVVPGDPAAPYRSLIEATEEDVALTIVDGDPLYGRPSLMQALKPGDFETLSASCGFQASLDVTDTSVPGGAQPFSDMVNLLSPASTLDFQHMKANFQDPAVAGMTDQEFQAYLDTDFPLGLIPNSLDPYWVLEDPDYFTRLRSETNVTALDLNASLDIESFWDTDSDGVLNPCEPALLRSTQPQTLFLHLVNLGAGFIDDVPGSLTDGRDYFYRIDERGGVPLAITVEAVPVDEVVRIHFSP